MVDNPSSSRWPEEEVKVDGERFDALLREVATPSSRRRIVGGVLGGVAALVAGTAVIKAVPGKGKGKGQNKVQICHKPDATTGEGQVITVAEPAVKAHQKHGDALCPVDECKSNAKKGSCTVTAGVATCDFTPRTGEPCADGTGTCDASGACIPNPIP
jgi:hypothetical protein